MRKVAVEEARAGDVVAEPVRDGRGRVLLPAGARLSPAVLSRLRGWGVSELSLEGEGEGGGKSARDWLDELEHRFSDHRGDALMMRIAAVARRHLSQL